MNDFNEKGIHYAPLFAERESEAFPALSGIMDSSLNALSIVAVCDIDDAPTDNLRPNVSVKITQCILLSDGSMISLDLGRGFTAISHWTGSAMWKRSADELINEILDLVRGDGPEKPVEHPWEDIAAAAQNRGIDIDAARAKKMPYQVFLSDRVIRTFEI